jgi:hypothetical protein
VPSVLTVANPAQAPESASQRTPAGTGG